MPKQSPAHLDLLLRGIDSDVDLDEPDAISSPLQMSSPTEDAETALDVNFNLRDDLSDYVDEDNESDYEPEPDEPEGPTRRAEAHVNSEKALAVLAFMRAFPRFPLRLFLETVFTSDNSDIRRFSQKFMSEESYLGIMDLWWAEGGGNRNERLATWAVEKAAEVCEKEASNLSNRASEGPHAEDVQTLRVSAQNVSVELVDQFRIGELTSRYERVTPHLQKILKAVISKDPKDLKPSSRDPDPGRTLITSTLLNLRSRKLNYHAVINSLLFWSHRVPKRLVQAFNHLGVCTSYPFQARSITALSKSAHRLAQKVANDPSKIRMLPYDNFNWMSRAWETSALHSSVTHDEVSALLIALHPPEGRAAMDITSISCFQELEGMRHRLPRRQVLEDILPNAKDHDVFRSHAIIHVQQILTEEVKQLHSFKPIIAAFDEPTPIPQQKTEEYYLPTFDQEQGSTRGNMVVLEHYFGKVLNIPKSTFEDTMFLVLGDRLTTARDRAAQDQRAVDRSEDRFDHLSSLSMVSGLMHFCLNFVQAIGGNAWGGDGMAGKDPVSLSTFRDVLPNRTTINLRKVDYYAWLRFLDVVLRSLVIRAATASLNVSGPEKMSDLIKSPTDFTKLAADVVDRAIVPSIARLEALGVKGLSGSTQSGHAVLLTHDLLTLREMRHAIKHGHPTRIKRMIKYWLPIFYAAGSYNYANECMELLHNVTHDWPADFAKVAFNAMLVNPTGEEDGHKETDIRVEHFNDDIKERAHGSNASPDVLEKTTPAIGHTKTLSGQFFKDIGVEKRNQHHASVLQHRDVEIAVKHLQKAKIFEFSEDKPSQHPVVDLYRSGLQRLSGSSGGHAKHLARHALRLRTRHNDIKPPSGLVDEDPTRELFLATDYNRAAFTVTEENDELANLVLESELLLDSEEDHDE